MIYSLMMFSSLLIILKLKLKNIEKILYRENLGNKMIEIIKKDWDININKSFMIGDKNSDRLAAKK